MFRVRHNGTYIGTMILSAVDVLAAHLCDMAGEVVTAEQDWDDMWDELPETTTTHTYYHNGRELLTFSHTEETYPIAAKEEQPQRFRTSAYTKRLTGFKYNREDARRHGGSRCAVRFMKRDINRAARRVGKALINEHIH